MSTELLVSERYSHTVGRSPQGESEELIKVSEDKFCLGRDSCQILQEALREKAKAVAESEMLTEIFQFGVWEFEKKNRRIVLLRKGIKERESIIKELQKENEKLRRRIEELKGRLNLLNKMLFGRKSEKKETEEAPVVKVTKRRGGQLKDTRDMGGRFQRIFQ